MLSTKTMVNKLKLSSSHNNQSTQYNLKIYYKYIMFRKKSAQKFNKTVLFS